MGDAPLLSFSFAYSFGCVGVAFKFFICELQIRFAGLALRLAFHSFLATNEVFRCVSF
jgi:hypothetical protein